MTSPDLQTALHSLAESIQILLKLLPPPSQTGTPATIITPKTESSVMRSDSDGYLPVNLSVFSQPFPVVMTPLSLPPANPEVSSLNCEPSLTAPLLPESRPACLPRANSKYGLADETYTFIAGNETFTMYGHHLKRSESDVISRCSVTSDGTFQLDDDITAVNFERFLDVLYCNVANSLPFTTVEEWKSVLLVADRYNFAFIKALVIREIHSIATCIDKIIIAREFGIKEWLRQAYTEVCRLPSLPSDEDCGRLGMDAFRKIARAREELRGVARFTDTRVSMVVEATFGLEKIVPNPAIPARSCNGSPLSPRSDLEVFPVAPCTYRPFPPPSPSAQFPHC